MTRDTSHGPCKRSRTGTRSALQAACVLCVAAPAVAQTPAAAEKATTEATQPAAVRASTEPDARITSAVTALADWARSIGGHAGAAVMDVATGALVARA